MTQYLLSVHGAEEDYAEIDPATVQQMFDDVDRFNAKVRDAGIWVFAGGLEPASTASPARCSRAACSSGVKRELLVKIKNGTPAARRSTAIAEAK